MALPISETRWFRERAVADAQPRPDRGSNAPHDARRPLDEMLFGRPVREVIRGKRVVVQGNHGGFAFADTSADGLGDPRRGRPDDRYGTLVRSIVGQQLSTIAARAIYTRMTDRYGGRPPTPAEVLADDPDELRVAAGLSPAIAKQVSSFNDALNGTEALVQALQAKDAAAIKKANDTVQAAVKAMGSPAESVPADYESKTFGPMQKAYDSAVKALKS